MKGKEFILELIGAKKKLGCTNQGHGAPRFIDQRAA